MSPKAPRFGSLKFPLATPTWPGSIPRPNPERNTGLDYDHDWSRRYPVRLARAMVLDNLTRPLMAALAPTTVRGLEYLEHSSRPLIFAANHASHVDTPVLLCTLPVDIRHRTAVAAAADFFFDRTWKAAAWSFALAAIPIERTKVNRRSADTAADLLDDGWSLLIFPEGGRSPDGWAQEFRGGAAYLSKRTGTPVVPVYMDGTRELMPKRPAKGERPKGGSGTEGREAPGLRRSRVSVLFGRPLTAGPDEDARRFAQRIEAEIALLASEARSDWWSARRGTAADHAAALRGPAEASSWRRAWALGPTARDLESQSQRWPKP